MYELWRHYIVCQQLKTLIGFTLVYGAAGAPVCHYGAHHRPAISRTRMHHIGALWPERTTLVHCHTGAPPLHQHGALAYVSVCSLTWCTMLVHCYVSMYSLTWCTTLVHCYVGKRSLHYSCAPCWCAGLGGRVAVSLCTNMVHKHAFTSVPAFLKTDTPKCRPPWPAARAPEQT